ncbi:MAG: NUDIX domain-containing protein [Proteobacteria bacterium]|nr:NUDIX domain-containing protein [Pseudomonadota bacterium]
MTPLPSWLDWAQRLQAIAQNGLAFSPNPYDRLRYEDVLEIVHEMLGAQTGGDPIAFETLFGVEKGYATPKVDVRGVVFQENRVLLVKERSDQRWTLPGGWADVGLSVRQVVEKEIHEESGYETRADRLLAVYDMRRHDHPPYAHHVYKVFVACTIIGGAPTHSLETEGVDFFALDALPELSLPRVTPAQIARFFALRDTPHAPVDFD